MWLIDGTQTGTIEIFYSTFTKAIELDLTIWLFSVLSNTLTARGFYLSAEMLLAYCSARDDLAETSKGK